MTDQEIFENLCYNDYRNPYSFIDEEEGSMRPVGSDDCDCDSCFRGKHKLAVEILRLRELLSKTKLAPYIDGPPTKNETHN